MITTQTVPQNTTGQPKETQPTTEPTVDQNAPEASGDSQKVTTEPSNTSLTKDEGAGIPKWHYTLPGALQGHEALSGYESIGQVVESLIDLKGKEDRMIEVPSEDASPEAKAEYFRKLGRPETVAGYELKQPKDWPSEVPWDDTVAKRFAEDAHEAGLTKAQAQHVWDRDAARAVAQHKQVQEAIAKQKAEWKEANIREYGAQYDEKIAQAVRAFKVIGSPQLAQLLSDHGLSDNPEVIKVFNRIWEKVGEDQFFNISADTVRERTRARYPNTKF